MKTLLYRRSLDAASGAGQLLLMHARALQEDGGDVTLACARGRAKFFLRTGWWPKRLSAASIRALQEERGVCVVDHSLEIPSADLVFVHNLESAAAPYWRRADSVQRIAEEAAFFRELPAATPIVANSRLVESALVARLGLAAERITVLYPGFRAERFNRARCGALRARARRALGLGEHTPLVGFVTSGDLGKRGLDLFLASAAEIARASPEAAFLVVGSKRLPAPFTEHPLVVDGTVRFRPKSSRPEMWFAALDVFLYCAHFEEFGMVILEAQACGLPILTSRRVGAAEVLPGLYERWLLETPDAHGFAELALALLGDRQARSALAAAGVANAVAFEHGEHARAALAAIKAVRSRGSSRR